MRACCFSVVVAVVSCSCAPLAVQQARPSSLQGVGDVSFLGAYDARVMLGGVQTTKTVTSVGAAPVYGASGYAGTIYYPQTSVVRTGEIAPNDALRLVAEGFSASINGGKVQDLSSTAPLEVRSEMGMDWFAKNNPELSNHLVSVEVKTASVSLDDAQTNWRLGIASVVLGAMAPCLACTTLPCFIYPAVAVTRARGESTGTLRVYDKKSGHVVHRVPIGAMTELEIPGFHDPEEVYKLLSAETGKRLGYDAAAKLAAFLHPMVAEDDANPAPRPPPKPTPQLNRPAATSTAPPPPASAGPR